MGLYFSIPWKDIVLKPIFIKETLENWTFEI